MSAYDRLNLLGGLSFRLAPLRLLHTCPPRRVWVLTQLFDSRPLQAQLADHLVDLCGIGATARSTRGSLPLHTGVAQPPASLCVRSSTCDWLWRRASPIHLAQPSLLRVLLTHYTRISTFCEALFCAICGLCCAACAYSGHGSGPGTAIREVRALFMQSSHHAQSHCYLTFSSLPPPHGGRQADARWRLFANFLVFRCGFIIFDMLDATPLLHVPLACKLF